MLPRNGSAGFHAIIVKIRKFGTGGAYHPQTQPALRRGGTVLNELIDQVRLAPSNLRSPPKHLVHSPTAHPEGCFYARTDFCQVAAHVSALQLSFQWVCERQAAS